MAEDKNTEYKESWRDEYLRQVCGMAKRVIKCVICHDECELVGVCHGTPERNFDNKALNNNVLRPRVCHGTPLHMHVSNDLRFNSQLTAEKLMHSHKSQPANPTIANTFYRAGFVEAWGRGISKMCQACEKWGCQQPEYIVDSTSLMLRFTPLFIQDDLPTEIRHVQQNQANFKQSTKQSTEQSTEQSILQCITDNPSASYQELAEMMHVGRSSLAKYISRLKESGLIQRIGNNRIGRWVIVTARQSEDSAQEVEQSAKQSAKQSTEQSILQCIADNPSASYQELAKMMHVGRSNLAKHISRLKEIGLIQRIGNNRTGRWVISSGQQKKRKHSTTT